MTTPESLCERHREFVPLIAAIERTEELTGEPPGVRLLVDAAQLHETLAHGLIPHAVGEGRTVFPTLRRVTGSDSATRELTEEHRRLARLTDELEGLQRELGADAIDVTQERLQALLEDLKVALRKHFADEEQACFEVLHSELGEDEAREMFEAMERASTEMRRAYE